MSTTLPLFWNLSSASKKERIDASVKLISALETLPVSFVPKEPSPASEDEEDDEEEGDEHEDSDKAALKKEAMGMGDMTLMAFTGAALGPGRAMATVFLGATIGAVAFLAIVYPVALLRRGRVGTQTELALGGQASTPIELPLVPFGLFLAPAAVIMLVWGDQILGRVFPALG